MKTLEELSRELEELRPAHNRFVKLNEEYWKRKEEEAQRAKQWARLKLEASVNYEPYTLPDIGVPGENGHAEFLDRAMADLFISSMNGYFGIYHELEWSGPGKYAAEPTYERDLDGDINYTVNFRKEN